MSQHPSIAGIPLVLGGNVFGWTASEDEGLAVLDAFYEAGGRMIDTADVYSAWVEGNKGGESEAAIGRWLASRGVRKDMRIHTKTGMLGGSELYAPERVGQSLDASLERLQTDRVDLYYAHKDYPELDAAQIADAFGATVAAGKVRELGASNFDTARLRALNEAADAAGTTLFTVLQNQYNLVSREAYPADLQSLCSERGIAMLPFFGLASGYLTGKYRNEGDFEKSARGGRVKELVGESGPKALAVMDAIAAETGAGLPAIALAWLVRQPNIPAPIASARTVDQLHELLEFTRLDLSDEQVARLDEAI